MMMNMKILGAVAALALLAGCTSNIDNVAATKGTGSPFTQALTTEYQAFVGEEKSEYDWGNADHFAQKGLLAAGGANVEPEDPANWDGSFPGSLLGHGIPADRLPELVAARARLMTALNGGARDAKPQDAAKAQARFDCWVEEQDENWEDDKIAACKNDFMAAMDALEKKEMAAAPAAPGNYTVYFDFDKSLITPAGQAVINDVLADAAKHAPSSISATGHTDLSGPADYNMALSLRRADAVRSALITGGIPADKITVAGRGMSDPAVPTALGVRNAKNRRVEIILQP
jgi:OmpA-OmpF porin, OOP family